MRIIRATDMGMCFGVRDALQVANAIVNPQEVTIHGELVHNPMVIYQLSQAGFHQTPEELEHREANTKRVLITAHGISKHQRHRLAEQGKQLIDTTCPLVGRVHDAATQLAAEDRHVLLIGKPGHAEVIGIVEDLDRCDVIAEPSDVREYKSKRLGVICQTTMPSRLVDEVRGAIELQNPSADIRFLDTVCRPTKLRQEAMLNLLPCVNIVVIVGGRNSNNTLQLVALCECHQVPARHVTCADEIEPQWFEDGYTVGLSAGTSTLDETIDAVHQRLGEIAASLRMQTQLQDEPETTHGCTGERSRQEWSEP